jgi:hypothetical protein
MVLDDDDAFLPSKIEAQIAAMRQADASFSSTEGLIGVGLYDHTKSYQRLNRQRFWPYLTRKLGRQGIDLKELGDLPERITHRSVLAHNYIITSSVCMRRALFDRLGPFRLDRPMHTDMPEDLDLWLTVTKAEGAEGHGVYLRQPLVYYDATRLYRDQAAPAPAADELM